MALLTMIAFFWDMKQCWLVICYRLFGGVCRSRLPVSRPRIISGYLESTGGKLLQAQVTFTDQRGLVSHRLSIIHCVAWRLGAGFTVYNSLLKYSQHPLAVGHNALILRSLIKCKANSRVQGDKVALSIPTRKCNTKYITQKHDFL